MKKLKIIVFLGLIYIGSSSTLTASPPILQQDCFNDFANCMNDAELEYYSALSVIQGSQEKAEKIYVSAVRSCVSGYNDCPQY